MLWKYFYISLQFSCRSLKTHESHEDFSLCNIARKRTPMILSKALMGQLVFSPPLPSSVSLPSPSPSPPLFVHFPFSHPVSLSHSLSLAPSFSPLPSFSHLPPSLSPRIQQDVGGMKLAIEMVRGDKRERDRGGRDSWRDRDRGSRRRSRSPIRDRRRSPPR